MGRKKLPTKIKELKGTLQPCRTNTKEPKPASAAKLPTPGCLSKDAAKLWAEIAPRFHRLGLLTECDVYLFADAIQSYADFLRLSDEIREEGEVIDIEDRDGQQISKKINPLVQVRDKCWARWEKIINKFGGNPSDRASIEVDLAEDDDIAGDIASKLKLA